MAKVRMSSRDIITLTLLVAMSAFFFADQRIMTAIIKELSIEYGVSESIIGLYRLGLYAHRRLHQHRLRISDR